MVLEDNFRLSRKGRTRLISFFERRPRWREGIEPDHRRIARLSRLASFNRGDKRP